MAVDVEYMSQADIWCSTEAEFHLDPVYGEHCPQWTAVVNFQAGLSTDRLYGKPGMLGMLTAVREMSGILLKVREKILSRKSDLKLFIISCIFVSFFDFAEFVYFILVFDHALLHSYPHHWQ